MSLANDFFSACTNARLEQDDVYLPLDPSARADLVNILADPESYIFLTISNERTIETVKARAEQGMIMLERGLEGTTAVLHRFGSTVCSITPTVMAVIKDLVCNYQCCDGPCPCAGVAFAGAVLPQGNAGQEWEGSVVFSGDLPIKFGISGMPSWMQATQKSNLLQISGTPSSAGTFSFSVAATNCNGTEIATQNLSVVITA